MIGGSFPTLPGEIWRYYSRNGFISLLKKSVPFLTWEIVERQIVTADEIVNQSSIHRCWEANEESSFSISEPSNQQLRREFGSYPKDFEPRPGKVYEINDCDLIGAHATGLYKGRGIISDTSGFRFGDMFVGSKKEIASHSVKSWFKIRPNKAKESVFPLICPDPSYYHWMLEYLPKLRYLELYQRETGEDPTLLIESNPRDFVRDTLNAAGYDSSQYVEWEQEETKVKKLIVATHRPHVFNYETPKLSNYNPSIQDFTWLRKRMRSKLFSSDIDKNTPNKIYVSRQKASRGRKVLNHSQLNSVLEKHGFDVYALEDLDFKEQLKIFYEADVIMGPHGAGLLNMIFAKEPTIIELFPDSVIKPHFNYLADIFNFDYRPIVSDSKNNDLVLDIDDIDQLLADI